jgi:hypothetical protein
MEKQIIILEGMQFKFLQDICTLVSFSPTETSNAKETILMGKQIITLEEKLSKSP